MGAEIRGHITLAQTHHNSVHSIQINEVLGKLWHVYLLMEAESDITIHVHGYSSMFTVSWFYTCSHYLFLCTNTAEEAYLSIPKSEDALF